VRRSPREFAILTALAMLGPLLALGVALGQEPSARFNDYHDYWLAGRLVAGGGNPYDLGALQELAGRENLQFLVGGGYSYLPPFAIAMVPLAALPFEASAWLFSVISVALFGLAVAAWLHRWHPTAAPQRRRLAAVACGVYPPVLGSVFVGQVNLVVGVLIAVGLAPLVAEAVRGQARTSSGPSGASEAIAGLALGLASVVKVYPVLIAFPVVLGRRLVMAAALAITFGGALLAAAVLAPGASQGVAGLRSLFEPDPYWTNQSLNGFASRLVLGTDQTSAPFPGVVPAASLSTVLIVLLGAATLGVLWLARGWLAAPRSVALASAFVLVAALAAAPKNSFWNQVPALVAVGTLLAVDCPDLTLERLRRTDRLLLALWGTSAAAQALVDALILAGGRAAAVATPFASTALYGVLVLWLVLARRLLAPQEVPAMVDEPHGRRLEGAGRAVQ
jgi:hypothetical protein